MTRLYVGNLSIFANEDALREMFAEYGTVKTFSWVKDRETGFPRGFGFVEMSTDDAPKAILALNGRQFDGRPMKVNEARDYEHGDTRTVGAD
jgi:RNA recognition motif-containing protein